MLRFAALAAATVAVSAVGFTCPTTGAINASIQGYGVFPDGRETIIGSDGIYLSLPGSGGYIAYCINSVSGGIDALRDSEGVIFNFFDIAALQPYSCIWAQLTGTTLTIGKVVGLPPAADACGPTMPDLQTIDNWAIGTSIPPPTCGATSAMPAALFGASPADASGVAVTIDNSTLYTTMSFTAPGVVEADVYCAAAASEVQPSVFQVAFAFPPPAPSAGSAGCAWMQPLTTGLFSTAVASDGLCPSVLDPATAALVTGFVFAQPPLPSPSSSSTASTSLSPTSTASATASATSTASSTASPTGSSTPSPTDGTSETATATATATGTGSSTPTPSSTPSTTPSTSPSPSLKSSAASTTLGVLSAVVAVLVALALA